jgi:hypothetical protein
MARNRKALGLALCATMALGAVVASAASGQTTEKLFHSEIEKTTLTATAITPWRFVTGPGEEFTCNKIEITSTITPKTTNDIKAVPHYSECSMKTGGLTIPAHIDTNSCYYTFTITDETETHHKYSGPTHIECTTPSDSITVTTTFLGGTQQCMHIPAQTPTTPTVDYTNEGKEKTRDIRVISTVKGFTYTKTSICGEGTFNNAELIGEVTIKGEEDKVGGAQVGIWVT